MNGFEMNVLLNYPTYILSDPNYYNVQDTASEWSLIGFYTEIAVIFAMFVIGPMFDMLGRKWPIVVT